MQAKTRRFGTGATLPALALSAALGVGVLAAGAAPVGADTPPSPPTLTSVFTPNLIGVGGTSSLSITISNPNATGTLTGIGLTDTLPGSLVVDNPNGVSNNCGASDVLTAAPGSKSISLSGGSVKPSASCTIAVAVTAAQPGAVENDTGQAGSSAGPGTSSAADLTVLAPPQVTVTSPHEHAVYGFGQLARARYSCVQPSDALALQDCSAQDDAGNDIVSGGSLHTTSPGTHQLFVSATSADGLVTTDTVDYRVLPDSRFKLSSIKASNGNLRLTLTLPGPGKLSLRELSGTTTVASVKRDPRHRGELTLTLHPTAAGARLLAQGPLKVKLRVAFTPTGGVTRTLTKDGIRLS